MATTSIRTAVARRVIELLRTDPKLAGVDVAYGYRRADGVGPDGVVLIQINDDGGNTNTHMKAGRKNRDDEWSLSVTVAVTFDDEEGGLQAAEKVEEMFGAVEDLCAANPTLQQDSNGIDGLDWAVLSGESNGPLVTPLDNGMHLAVWEALIACRARLS